MVRGKYNPSLDAYDYIEVPDVTDKLMDDLASSSIDPTIEVNKPQIIFAIREKGAMQFENRRVFTLGNFSAIIGKAKSKKTFLLSAISAAIIKRGLMWDKFHGGIDSDKDMVLYFDTEQGDWDSWNVVRRIVKMAGRMDRFKAYNLRRFTPSQRCDLIEHAFKTYGDQVGFVVIDGIADLAKAINDEEEATRVVSLLMRWTKDYQCHIATVIHQNKADNYATGHLGSSITKKCEIIMSVTKDENNYNESTVKCEMSRAVDFKPFKLVINPDGIPVIDDVIIDIDNRFSVIDEPMINEEAPF